jgi:ferrochelatase
MDAVLLIAFGGPTSMQEVRPFLANVLRGRPIPPERVEEVVRHYEEIGGRSPLNELTFRQASALRDLLQREGPQLPVYVGMRNWHPYLRETLARIRDDGHSRVIGLILSPQRNEAGWDRYQQNVREAREQIGPGAPHVEFLPPWNAHPLFIEAVSDRVELALAPLQPGERAAAALVFTAHSIPTKMAEDSGYAEQIDAAAHVVAERIGCSSYTIAYQSRSGNPRDPWLEPDIGEVIRERAATGTKRLVVVPIGFVCDHVEVLYDLDVEAKRIATEAGVELVRAQTVNDHPAFIRMMANLVRDHLRSRGEETR